MKIQFLSINYPVLDEFVKGRIFTTNPYWWIRAFYEHTRPLQKQVKWCDPIIFGEKEEIVEKILEENPDILGVPQYIWLEPQHTEICLEVRKRNSNIKIICGGPNVETKNLKSNFEKWSFTDAIVYGDGEEAFAEMIDYFLKNKTIKAGTNLATRDDYGTYKRFRYEDYEPYTVYAQYTDEMKIIFDKYREKYGNEREVVWHTETTRGCPYGCSFCDWSSGLHHKVSIREESVVIKDLIAITKGVHPTHSVAKPVDANWGMLKRDEKITRYCIENDISLSITNWNKLKKEKTLDLYREYYNHFIKERLQVRQTISLQSIKEESLKAIDRPSVPWKEHKPLIKKTRQNLKEKKLNAEIILDLPYMELEDYFHLYSELWDAGFNSLETYDWFYAPNSPCSDPRYREQYNLEIVEELEILADYKPFGSVDISNCLKMQFVRKKNHLRARTFAKVMRAIFNYQEIEENVTKHFIKNMDKALHFSDKLYEMSKNNKQPTNGLFLNNQVYDVEYLTRKMIRREKAL